MFDFDLKSMVLGAALISLASFKWPGVSVWVNDKISSAYRRYNAWRAIKKATKK